MHEVPQFAGHKPLVPQRRAGVWKIAWLCKLSCALCLLAGCGSNLWPCGYGEACYGVPTPPHDPKVALLDFTYTPASPIQAGAKLSFTAHSNKAFNSGELVVRVGAEQAPVAWLRDDGIAPDPTAHDGEWRGEAEWRSDYPRGQAIPVRLELAWYDYTEGQILIGPPLDVEE